MSIPRFHKCFMSVQRSSSPRRRSYEKGVISVKFLIYAWYVIAGRLYAIFYFWGLNPDFSAFQKRKSRKVQRLSGLAMAALFESVYGQGIIAFMRLPRIVLNHGDGLMFLLILSLCSAPRILCYGCSAFPLLLRISRMASPTERPLSLSCLIASTSSALVE